MKRILLLIKGLGLGGAERVVVNIARNIDRSRFDVEVAYLLPAVDELRATIEQLGVTVHCLGGGRSAQWIARVRELVRDCRFELVHAHSPYAAVGARLALPRGRVRHVYTEHALPALHHPATFAANLLTLGLNDHVFAVSESVKRAIRYPLPLRVLKMRPVEVLYHGNDPADVERWRASNGARDALGVPEGVPVVGTVASFRPEKGYEHLVSAVMRVRQAVPEARFVFVGGGPLEPGVRRRALALGLADTIVFAGAQAEAPRLVEAFDVFVLASTQEAFAMSLVEAMALRKPVVVTRSGGPAEIVEDGRDGVVVAAGDPDALGDAVVSLLRDAPRRERLAAAAERRAPEFDVRKAVLRMEAVYEELLS